MQMLTNEYNTGISFDGANLTVTDAGGNQVVDISGVSTDDQNISGSGLAGTDLTIGIEGGTSETIDLSSLVGTDDQNISGSGLAGTDLTIGIEGGTSETIDLSSLVGTDDQNLTLATNTLSIEDGNSVDLTPYLDNTDDQTIDGLSMVGGALNISLEDDGVAPSTVNMISSDANNDIAVGTDGSLYLNVASVTISETITNIADNGNGTFTYTNESGAPQTINKADLTDNLDGTFTFDNGNGSPITFVGTDTDTDDQTLSLVGSTLSIADGNSVDLSGFVSTDDQNLTLVTNTLSIEDGNSVDLTPYLDNTDDQNISGSGLAGTDLTIGIEGGTSETIDLSSLVGTDDQTLSTTGAAGNITIEDGNTININVDDADADPTNEYNTGISFDGANLTVTDAGGNQVVDISGVSTDDQNISGSGLAGTDLTIGIEGGTSETIDLSSLVGTDDQNISGSGLAGTDLTIGIEGGTSETIDLSSLVGTDDQNLTLATNTLSIEDGNSVDLTPYLDNTDDQNISGSGLAGTDLTIGIEGGTSETIDLSSLVGTDDQTLSTTGAAGNITIEDGNTININVDDADADPTNEYNTGISFDGTNLTVTDAGGNQVVDISGVSTDDQTLSTTGAAGNITIEDGNTININVDDADADPTNEYNTGISFDGANLTVTDAGGNQVVDISGVSTDDQNISGSGLAGTVLTIGIEGGTSETVDLASIDTDTDDQTLSIVGDQLSIADGNTVTIPTADGSETIVNGGGINVVTGSGTSGDPYIVTGTEVDGSVTNEVNTAFVVNAGNLEITDSNGTLSVPVSSLGTDDQNLTLATNTLSIEDGNSVDLSPYLDNTATRTSADQAWPEPI